MTIPLHFVLLEVVWPAKGFIVSSSRVKLLLTVKGFFATKMKSYNTLISSRYGVVKILNPVYLKVETVLWGLDLML